MFYACLSPNPTNHPTMHDVAKDLAYVSLLVNHSAGDIKCSRKKCRNTGVNSMQDFRNADSLTSFATFTSSLS